MQKILYIYSILFSRKCFFKIHKFLYKVSLRGLGIGNYESSYLTGEKRFLKMSLSALTEPVIFDVGANVGNYSSSVLKVSSSARLFSFEPNPIAYHKLKNSLSIHHQRARCFNLGMGHEKANCVLYDKESSEGSSHASIYSEVMSKAHGESSIAVEVEIDTIDNFCAVSQVEEIHLLKIDTEGHELKVLLGSRDMIKNKCIKLIQIEFNEMAVYSRYYMRDILDILSSYKAYRMLPDGIVDLGNYSPLNFEIFAFQNIVFCLEDVKTCS